MKKKLTKDTLLSTYYLAFIVCLLVKLVLTTQESYFAFDMSEWLINYQGGFVRRGLKGEILLFLYKTFAIKPYTVVSILCSMSFFLLAFILYKKFIEKGYSIFVLPFVFFLGNTIINYCFLKIDSLLILLFIFTIFLIKSKPKFYIVWVNIVFIITILMHEAFAFFALPIIFLLIFHDINTNKTKSSSYTKTFLALMPSVLAFIVICLFKGTHNTSIAIWESLKDIPFPRIKSVDPSIPQLAIDAVGYTMEKNLSSFTGIIIRAFGYGLYAPLMLVIIITIVYFILSNINMFNNKILGQNPIDLKNKPVISAVLFFQFCTTIPLYILAGDTARWISIWTISSFVILVFLPDKTLNVVFPNIIYNISQKINNILFRFLGNSKSTLIILTIIIGYPIMGWWFLYGIEASSLYMVLKNISGLMRLIFKLLGVDMVEFQ